jgi:hypothetical protein
MASVRAETISSFNAFIEEQRKGAGKAFLTLVKFDHEYEVAYEGKDILEVDKLNEETYVPRGYTALNDAICRAVDATGKRLKDLPESERPGLVIFVIQTDGQENASKEFSIEQVKSRISTQRNVYKWQFIFLGAGEDALHQSLSYGISKGTSLPYSGDPFGTKLAIYQTSQNINSARGMQASGGPIAAARASLNYTAEQIEEQAKLRHSTSGRL